ncbi:hypothetical protein Q1695_003172 [Nippostrongylus brasiliensis]|nr:hypothetical protein Q1695_003172 [Nippostrongylus brasiliensis]
MVPVETLPLLLKNPSTAALIEASWDCSGSLTIITTPRCSSLFGVLYKSDALRLAHFWRATSVGLVPLFSRITHISFVMFRSRFLVIALCCLTTAAISSRLCGVVLVHRLGKMCRQTSEEKCSTLNYDDINIPIMDVAQRCCSEQCSFSYMQAVCCALNYGPSHRHRQLSFSTKDLYETLA